MRNWRLRVVVEGRNTRALEVKVVELENGRLQREEPRGRDEIIMRMNKKREGEEDLEEGEVVAIGSCSRLNGNGSCENVQRFLLQKVIHHREYHPI